MAPAVIEKYMQERNIQYRLWTTKTEKDAPILTRKAIDEGADLIVSVGGDGTVNEVINEMYGTGIPLGVIGAGSGNDFALMLYKTEQKFTEKSIISNLDQMLSGTVKKIDLIKCGGIYMANCGSVGLDAEIGAYANHLKKRYGRYSYVVACLIKLITFKPFPVKLIIDGEKIDSKIFFAAANNGKRYGGNFNMTPTAEFDDGLITVCFIKKLNKLRLIYLLPGVIIGKHERFNGVCTYNCKEITIFFDGKRLINIDGNMTEMKDKVTFNIVPAAMPVVF